MLTHSQKKYLLAIYKLSLKERHIKSVDVAKMLGVSKPSTVKAVQSLKDLGYVVKEPYRSISMSEKGIYTAEKLCKNESSIKKLLSSLGINQKTAECDSAEMALILSDEAIRKIAETFS